MTEFHGNISCCTRYCWYSIWRTDWLIHILVVGVKKYLWQSWHQKHWNDCCIHIAGCYTTCYTKKKHAHRIWGAKLFIFTMIQKPGKLEENLYSVLTSDYKENAAVIEKDMPLWTFHPIALDHSRTIAQKHYPRQRTYDHSVLIPGYQRIEAQTVAYFTSAVWTIILAIPVCLPWPLGI